MSVRLCWDANIYWQTTLKLTRACCKLVGTAKRRSAGAGLLTVSWHPAVGGLVELLVGSRR
jgi:hypothetical protein